MKKSYVLVVSLVLALGIAGWYGVRIRQQQQAVPVAKEMATPKPKAPPEPEEEKSLTFWSGEVIIGEGDNCGQIELLAHEGRKSVVLAVDDDGRYGFDSIPLMKKGEMYIRLQDDGPPLISLVKFRDGKPQPLHPLYELTDRAKKRFLGALITYKAIGDPMTQVRPRQAGQFFEGRTWSMASHNQQLLGRE